MINLEYFRIWWERDVFTGKRSLAKIKPFVVAATKYIENRASFFVILRSVIKLVRSLV